MKEKNKIKIINRKASFNYELIESFTAGICLKGTEIKSIKESNASFNNGFCFFKKNEIYIRGLYVSEYSYGNTNNHDPMRDKKLLLNKNEIIKLKKNLEEKNISIVPRKLFINNKGLAKIEIALAKGKKLVDKRESIKKKDIERKLKQNY